MADPFKALTIQQPWAWAVIYASKDVENRTQLWAHRGPLAIHAGARTSERGLTSTLIRDALRDGVGNDREYRWPKGAVIGVVDFTGGHAAEPGCCDSPWAEQSYVEHGGRERRNLVHLEFANPRPTREPIYTTGRLGLWTLPPDVAAALRDQGLI